MGFPYKVNGFTNFNSMEFTFSGGQGVLIDIFNNSFSGSMALLTEKTGFERTHEIWIGPQSTYSCDFSLFSSEPIRWQFEIYSGSDVCSYWIDIYSNWRK